MQKGKQWPLMLLMICLIGFMLAACGASLRDLDKQLAKELVGCPPPPQTCPPDTLNQIFLIENGQIQNYAVEAMTTRNPDNTLITHTRKISLAQPIGRAPNTISEKTFDQKFLRKLFKYSCPPPPQTCPPDTLYIRLINGNSYQVEALTIKNLENTLITHILRIMPIR